jgi:hypothetical protein
MKARISVTAWLAAVLLLTAAACSESPAPSAKKPSGPTVHSLTGGCAGTTLTDAEPPTWAQDGWFLHAKGTPWALPWAMNTSGDAVAFLFANHLVAGTSPRVDGTNNKVLWVLRYARAFVVKGTPLGKSDPIVSVVGGPSIVDAPLAGCWSFQLVPQGSSPLAATINLDVLPQGSRAA